MAKKKVQTAAEKSSGQAGAKWWTARRKKAAKAFFTDDVNAQIDKSGWTDQLRDQYSEALKQP